MDLTSVPTIKNLLQKHEVHPTKHLGQNFLVNADVVKKLVDAAKITKNDIVVEVGAGLGTITIPLARRAKQVIAIEKDEKLIPILKKTTADCKNVKIMGGDILKIKNLGIDWKLEIGNWKLLGNIPYYLTAPLIRKFLETPNPPQSMTLMVQKEMAQRICAKPPEMSILAVSTQLYATPKIIHYISRSSFWPAPEVDSAIIHISQITQAKGVDTHTFFAIVKTGFKSPRKQLVNNLSSGLKISSEETKGWLRAADVDPKRRAETLTIAEWKKLTETLISKS